MAETTPREEGFEAGRFNQPIGTNPYRKGWVFDGAAQFAAEWDQGHAEGLEEYRDALAEHQLAATR